ncbi:MAG: 30S ribosomal protein S3 [Asgard group archaeon]
MPVVKNILKDSFLYTQIDEFLAKRLKRAGYAGLDIRKTPLGTRVIVYAAYPGIVIGRRGRNINDLTKEIEKKFNFDSVQVEISEVENPELNAKIMASRLISSLERGFQFRRAGYSIIRRVMKAGARGCEVRISGKLTSQRSRTITFRQGFVAKCGEPAKIFVDEAVAYSVLKPGVTGVKVRIMRPDAKMPDEIAIKQLVEVMPPKEEVIEEEVEIEEVEEGEIIVEEILEEEKKEVEEVVEEVEEE